MPIEPPDYDVDFGRTSADYGRHRQGFPDSVFERLAALGVGAPVQRVLDLGTGTGAMARGLASRGAEVTATDRARAMTDRASELDREAGVRVRYAVAPAEALPFADASFEAVTAAQCWHWFERPRATLEARRVLVPGGALALVHLDWLPRPGSVVAATEALILAHNPSWHLGGLDGLHVSHVAELEAASFDALELFAYDHDLVYSHADWRGRIRASAGIGAALDPTAVERFDRELAALLASEFAGDPLVVPHRVFCALGRRPRR